MSRYLKLDYKTPGTNEALKEAIAYIGRYYGKHACESDIKNSEYLKDGVKYVARKFGRFRIKAIKTMIYAKKISGSDNRRWCFNKQTFVGAYGLIIEKLLERKGDDAKEVMMLLERLYNETKQHDPKAEKVCSNALIYWQMKILHVNSLHENSDVAYAAERMYKGVVNKDKQIPRE